MSLVFFYRDGSVGAKELDAVNEASNVSTKALEVEPARFLAKVFTIHLGILILKPSTAILNGGSYLSLVIALAVFEFF